MRVKCAWCDLDMGVKEPVEDNSVSHGICPKCFEVVMLEIEEIRLRSSVAERHLGKMEVVGSTPTEGSHNKDE